MTSHSLAHAALTLLLLACDTPAPQPDADAFDDGIAADTALLDALAPAPMPAPVAATEARPQRDFAWIDPANIPADSMLGGLRIEHVNVTRMQSAEYGNPWVGEVRLRGEIEVSGTWKSHFDYPEVDLVCQWPRSYCDRPVSDESAVF